MLLLLLSEGGLDVHARITKHQHLPSLHNGSVKPLDHVLGQSSHIRLQLRLDQLADRVLHRELGSRLPLDVTPTRCHMRPWQDQPVDLWVTHTNTTVYRCQ